MSIRELAKLGFKHSDKWLTELIWRDFYQAIIHAFPHSAKDAFRPQYDRSRGATTTPISKRGRLAKQVTPWSTRACAS